ncbi:MAG: DUF2283 domain-containing protein [Candidatus Acididesulfobacter diazotrophicus]|jgi:uncharacterized protein YuzE|uniref:DUF2283 domain-containing protein n=1 Tax=Candidatus Acididesulfobacter diazotrophicus TaxID=2597226 RepID=A0A519BJU8_9DELT|nr:MAG: DUF2283 domain-containing protein [Candidatus Acididesulfobacter diazotrophicus]
MLKIDYDKDGDILEIRFSDSPIKDSEYINESGLVIDYDKDGKIAAVEVISFSKRVAKNNSLEALAV